MADVHARVLKRIPAYRHGLLEAEGAQEVRAHLRECADCRATFEPFRDPTEDEETRPGHVPIALISRWDVFAPRLAEPERALLEGHFEACERCRTSREFGRAMRARRPDRERTRRRWMGFGTAAMAALAAVVAIVVLRERPAPQVAQVPRVEQVPPLKVAPAPVRTETVALQSPSRGEPSPMVRVPRGATILPIRVPPLLGVGPDARIRIRVDGPGGVPFGHAELAHRALFGEAAPPALDAQAPEGPLPPGHYRVVVVSDVPDPQVPGSFEGAEYGFDLGLK